MSRDLIGMFHDRQHHLINFLIKWGKEFTHFLFFPICYLKVCSGTKKNLIIKKECNDSYHTHPNLKPLTNEFKLILHWF